MLYSGLNFERRIPLQKENLLFFPIIFFHIFAVLLISCETRVENFNSLEDTTIDALTDISTPEVYIFPYKEPPELITAFLSKYRDRLKISVWHTEATIANKPYGGELGSFGIGNGKVFGFSGLTYPLNTIHSLIGPTYEKDDRFFGDLSLIFYENDSEVRWKNEYILRSLAGPFNVILEKSDTLYSEILDFTPLISSEDPIFSRCLIRIINIKNLSYASSDITIRLKTANAQRYENNLMIENREKYSLISFFINSGETSSIFYDENGYGIKIEGLEKSNERTLILIHYATEKDSEILTSVNIIKNSINIDRLIDETLINYERWTETTTEIITPDRMINDLIDGLKLALKVQTTEYGAACPMSEYTRVWTRDLMGFVVGFLSIGAFDDVNRILNYLYKAILKTGDIANSYRADIDTSTQYTVLDWDNMPPLSGRTAAEGPSHIPIYHHLYYQYTGETQLAKEQIGLLKRALLKQEISAEGLLPYSGDETYRAAMNAAFGLPLEYEHHTKSYSPNSSILFIRAAKGLIELIKTTGETEDIAKIEELLKKVEDGFYKHFVLPDGCISAFIERETLTPYAAPFEDESLTLSFLGNKYYSEDIATKSLKCLFEKIHADKGVLLSPINSKYKDFLGIKVRKGILTGMLSGYTLASLTENNHTEKNDAFNQMVKYADSSGNYGEYLLYDNRDTISLIYDPNGKQGDYTARFRPWEGGINLYSIIDYLIGFRISQSEKIITLRPHLPNNWEFLEARNIKFNNDNFDIKLTRENFNYTLNISTDRNIDYRIELIIDVDQKSKFSLIKPEIDYQFREGHFQESSYVIELSGLKNGITTIKYSITPTDL